MDGLVPSRRLRAGRALILAAAALLPGAAGSSAIAETGADTSDAFTASFARFDTEPEEFRKVAHAVDISAIDVPLEAEEPATTVIGGGTASYYGRRFHGRRTANGERFDMGQLTAAHRTLPFGSMVRVTNANNGRSVVVRINDRGPFSRGRVIDLSRAAAEQIGLIRRGHGRVELELLR